MDVKNAHSVTKTENSVFGRQALDAERRRSPSLADKVLMIWPIMSYGSETWIYLKSVQNMINVFERWCYRRMLCISWTEHVTNEEVFNRANTKPTLLDGLLKRRLAFHGHLVRKGGITLDLMIGRLHGTRPRGRPRTTWLKDLATQANISYKEAITIPRDRKKWRSVGNPRRTPDD